MSFVVSRRRALTLSLLSPFAVTHGAAAQDPLPQKAGPAADAMAMVGFAGGQRLRLSVFHVLEAVGVLMPCDFQAVLIGADGKTLASANGSVIPGQATFVDFAPAARMKRGERIQVHGALVILGSFQGDDPAHHAPFVGATLEVFDEKTGETNSVAFPERTLGQGRHMGTVGIVRGQRARVNLYHLTDPFGVLMPCDYQIHLIGLDGKALGLNTGTLFPGQGAFFDHNLAANTAKGERTQFHVQVRRPPDHPVSGAVEIVDEQTGITRAMVEPWIVDDPTLG
jgi:hypothetical protein